MAKKQRIIFVVNFHTNETPVTAFYGEELRKKFEAKGYDASVYPIDGLDTPESIVRQSIADGKPISMQAAEEQSSRLLKSLRRALPEAIFVDLHCREDALRKPSRMTASASSYFYRTPFPANFDQITDRISNSPFKVRGEGNEYSIEVPAVFVQHDEEHRKIASLLPKPERYNIARDQWYFLVRADLKKTKAANILNPRNIDKITHALDSDIKIWQGKYRLPRGTPFAKNRSLRYRKRSKIRDQTQEYGRKISPNRRIGFARA